MKFCVAFPDRTFEEGIQPIKPEPVFQHRSSNKSPQLSRGEKKVGQVMRTVLAEPTQTEAKGVLTCLTTSADPSTLSVVDLKGRETRTQFFPLFAEQC